MLGVERRRHRSFGRVALLGEHPLIRRIAHRLRHQNAQPLALSEHKQRPAILRHVRAQVADAPAVAHLRFLPRVFAVLCAEIKRDHHEIRRVELLRHLCLHRQHAERDRQAQRHDALHAQKIRQSLFQKLHALSPLAVLPAAHRFIRHAARRIFRLCLGIVAGGARAVSAPRRRHHRRDPRERAHKT